MNLSDVTRKAAAALSFNWHLLDRSFLSFLIWPRVELSLESRRFFGVSRAGPALRLFDLTVERGRTWVYKGARAASLSRCDHSLFVHP